MAPVISTKCRVRNGERVYVYRTVANFLEHVVPQQSQETVRHLRGMADSVAKAVNQVLWLDKEGWYGTKQARWSRDSRLFNSSCTNCCEYLG